MARARSACRVRGLRDPVGLRRASESDLVSSGRSLVQYPDGGGPYPIPTAIRDGAGPTPQARPGDTASSLHDAGESDFQDAGAPDK